MLNILTQNRKKKCHEPLLHNSCTPLATTYFAFASRLLTKSEKEANFTAILDIFQFVVSLTKYNNGLAILKYAWVGRMTLGLVGGRDTFKKSVLLIFLKVG